MEVSRKPNICIKMKGKYEEDILLEKSTEQVTQLKVKLKAGEERIALSDQEFRHVTKFMPTAQYALQLNTNTMHRNKIKNWASGKWQITIYQGVIKDNKSNRSCKIFL